MYRVGVVLLLLVPSLAHAGTAPEVDEPDHLPPPAEAERAAIMPASSVEPGQPATYRKSVVLEAGLGVGFLVSGVDGTDGGFGLAGLNLGIGGFLRRDLAITGRVANLLAQGDPQTSLTVITGSVQYWRSDRLWAGAGLGLAYVGGGPESLSGLGLDLRAGYTFRQTRAHSFNAALEILPALVDGTVITGISLVVGYQYL